MLVLTAIL